jgi:UDP-N-acetylmuramyl tripeptide synthase
MPDGEVEDSRASMDPLCGTRSQPVSEVLREKRHHSEDSALKRALWIYRNPSWGIKVLSIEGTNGKRMAAGEIEAWCEHAAASEGPSE